MTKRLLRQLLPIVALLVLAACGESPNEPSPKPKTTTPASTSR